MYFSWDAVLVPMTYYFFYEIETIYMHRMCLDFFNVKRTCFM